MGKEQVYVSRGECLLQERATAQGGLRILIMGLEEDGFEIETFFFDGACTYLI